MNAYVFGYVITNRKLPFDTHTTVPEQDFTPELLGALGEDPYLTRVAGHLIENFSFHEALEFRHGLDPVRDGVERQHGPTSR